MNAELSHNHMNAGQASLSPHDLENLIECWRTMLVHEIDQERQRYAATRMRELIAKRTLTTIERMELERGLRAP